MPSRFVMNDAAWKIYQKKAVDDHTVTSTARSVRTANSVVRRCMPWVKRTVLYGAGSVVGVANGTDALTTLKNTWVIVSGYVATESVLKNADK